MFKKIQNRVRSKTIDNFQHILHGSNTAARASVCIRDIICIIYICKINAQLHTTSGALHTHTHTPIHPSIHKPLCISSVRPTDAYNTNPLTEGVRGGVGGNIPRRSGLILVEGWEWWGCNSKAYTYKGLGPEESASIAIDDEE